MKRLTLFGVGVGLVLGVGACEREQQHQTATEELHETAVTDPGYRTDQPAPVVAVPDTAGGQTLTGNLMEMQNSGVSGGVTLTPQNGRTAVLLRLRGVQPNSMMYPTIHRGRCDTMGQPVVNLQPVTVDATGLATPTDTANVAIQSLTDGQHSVRVFTERAAPVPPVACADLPRGIGAAQ